MRLIEAWGNLIHEIQILRLTTLALFVTTIVLGIAVARLAYRDPLVIERGERGEGTQLAVIGGTAPTPAERDTFIKQALAMRFDTGAEVSSDALSLEELKARLFEQEELSRRTMKQRVLVNGVTSQGDQIRVDADRLISVGTIRSAFSFPLEVQLGSAPRTKANPYGLVLVQTKPLETDSTGKSEGKSK